MVPVLDMVNHSSEPSAYYEEDEKNGVMLLVRSGSKISGEEEVSISYGDAKPAAEMLFSYGFIDPRSAADGITLPLEPFSDDPLAKAKLHIFEGPPTVTIRRTDGEIEWKSPFAYLMCLNEEDGLAVRVLQDTGGSRELRVFWQDEDVTDKTHSFPSLIGSHPYSQIFRLRVVTVVADRLSTQLEHLHSSSSLVPSIPPSGEGLIRPECVQSALLLKEMEAGILEVAAQVLEDQVCRSFLRIHQWHMIRLSPNNPIQYYGQFPPSYHAGRLQTQLLTRWVWIVPLVCLWVCSRGSVRPAGFFFSSVFSCCLMVRR
jgi:hypothetical protein